MNKIKRSYEDRTCKYCGTIFAARSDKATKFCSRRCANQRSKSVRPCLYCGKLTKQKRAIYCSQACAIAAKHFRCKRIIFCGYCGKQFERPRSHVNVNNFCSRRCQNQWQTQYRVGIRAPRWHPVGSVVFRKASGDCLRAWVKVYGPNGWILRARHLLVTSGYRLASDDIVHHRNGITTDDRLDNLTILTRQEHICIHRINLREAKRVRTED